MLLQLLFDSYDPKQLVVIIEDISKSRGNIFYIDFRGSETVVDVTVEDVQAAEIFWDHFLQTESFLLLNKGGVPH